MIPGPTPVPAAVLEALHREPLGHRTKEFSKLLLEVSASLKQIAECDNDVFVLTGSGTAAMEAALANTLSPGDKILSLVCGVFGERFAKIAEAYGIAVERLPGEVGSVVAAETLRDRLRLDRQKSIKAVTITHNETSTGVISNLEHLAYAVREHGALCLVDAVTTFGASPVAFSKWGIDVMVAGSQKALMLPPGLAFIFFGERAWQAHANAKSPRFYLDLKHYREALKADTSPFTPNVSFVAALKIALDLMKEEGLQAVYARHERLKAALRAGILGMGLKLFVKDAYASPTITAILPPENIAVDSLRRILKERFQIRIADGQEELKGKIFRIGHMGYVFERDILMTLAALEASLLQLGYSCPQGIGVGSALALLNS